MNIQPDVMCACACACVCVCVCAHTYVSVTKEGSAGTNLIVHHLMTTINITL